MSTYTPIISETLTSAQPAVTFSSIPGTYTDLIIIVQGTTTTGNANVFLRFNSDTGNNYSFTGLGGSGGAAVSQRSSNANAIQTEYYGYFDQTIGNRIIHIMNYANTTTYKTVVGRGNNSNNGASAIVGLWRNTSAITSVTVIDGNTTFTPGSTFSLYGIVAEDTTAKATGGDVTTDGTYYYHTFRNSGFFTTLQNLTNVDYLVIAGGGAGSAGQVNNSIGAGGGAGGLRSTVTATGGGGAVESKISLTANTSYTVTVGAGGAANTSQPNFGGLSGNNSVFNNITSTGGGGGGGNHGPGAPNGDGVSGGSGGGGRIGSRPGGAPIIGQGYAGGNGGNVSGGGGGGSGGAGGNGSGSTGGNGGSGVSLSTWASPTGTGVSNAYAGGGGGSSDTAGRPSGGSGGGGIGSAKNNGNGGPGTGNTGSGGGGGTAGDGSNQWGGNGGSGIVIVRYLV